MASAFESMFGRVGGARRALILGVGIAAAAGVLAVSRWATAPTMVPLYADLPIDATGPLTDELADAGIPFSLEKGGSTVLVPASDVARARVAIARAPLPRAGAPGLELFDQAAWGMTDFTQRINYRRALEGELERSITTMEGVERVDVHLALEEQRLFASDQRQSKASVTLAMMRGANPDAAMVEGIQRLVAGAVGGLEPAHVTIVDARGRPLTTMDDGSLPGQTSRQLAVRQELERGLEAKAAGMLDGIVGAGNYKVQVAADLNFDELARETRAVDPEQQVVAVEHKQEIIPGSADQGAASSNVATQFEGTRSVEQYRRNGASVTRLSVAVLVADAMSPTAAAETPTFTPRTEAELARIASIVRTAVGVDSARGDVLTVVSAPFGNVPMVVAASAADSLLPPTLTDRVLENPKPAIAIAAILALLTLAFVLVRALKATAPPRPQPQPALKAAAPNAGALPQPAAPRPEPEPVPQIPERAPVVLPPPPTTMEREQAIATVEQRPDAAVRVVRSWLRS